METHLETKPHTIEVANGTSDRLHHIQKQSRKKFCIVHLRTRERMCRRRAAGQTDKGTSGRSEGNMERAFTL
jgi:hypothetical protein